MVAVDRVHDYANLEPEEDAGVNKDLPKELPWPTEGQIVALNASFKYHHTLPHVLNRINFTIKPAEKVRNNRKFSKANGLHHQSHRVVTFFFIESE